MVGSKIGQVVMAAAFDGEQLYVLGIDLLEQLAIFVGDQPVAVAVQEVDRKFNFFEILVGANLVAQQPPQRQQKSVAFDLVVKTVIRRIQNEHTRPVPGGHARRNAGAHRTTIDHDFILRVAAFEPVVQILRVVVQDLFGAFAPAFSEAAVVHHKKIVAIAHEIAGKFGPAFDAARVAFEVINDAPAVGHPEKDGVDAPTVFHFEGFFFKIKGILVFEISGQSLWAEKEKMLEYVKYGAYACVDGCQREKE